jgi:hypothetical protein
MKSLAKLKIVTKTHRPIVDIYESWRAEVASRNWSAVHVQGDRSEPVELPQPRKGRRA